MIIPYNCGSFIIVVMYELIDIIFVNIQCLLTTAAVDLYRSIRDQFKEEGYCQSGMSAAFNKVSC